MKSLHQLIQPYTFIPPIAAIETALHSGSLAAVVAAVDAALRDPKIRRATPLCEALREWRNAVVVKREVAA